MSSLPGLLIPSHRMVSGQKVRRLRECYWLACEEPVLLEHTLRVLTRKLMAND
jgi:hypothetical protein